MDSAKGQRAVSTAFYHVTAMSGVAATPSL